MHQNVLDLVRLLDPYTNSNTIYAWLDEDLLVLIARYRERIEKDFWRAGGFNFWDVMPL